MDPLFTLVSSSCLNWRWKQRAVRTFGKLPSGLAYVVCSLVHLAAYWFTPHFFFCDMGSLGGLEEAVLARASALIACRGRNVARPCALFRLVGGLVLWLSSHRRFHDIACRTISSGYREDFYQSHTANHFYDPACLVSIYSGSGGLGF